MSNFVQRMQQLRRDHTLYQSPSMLIWEHGFFTGQRVEGCKLIHDKVVHRGECLVKFEVNGSDQIRAVFLGIAGPLSGQADLSPIAAAYRKGSNTTPFFDYEDRLHLAAIVKDRLMAVL